MLSKEMKRKTIRSNKDRINSNLRSLYKPKNLDLWVLSLSSIWIRKASKDSPCSNRDHVLRMWIHRNLTQADNLFHKEVRQSKHSILKAIVLNYNSKNFIRLLTTMISDNSRNSTFIQNLLQVAQIPNHHLITTLKASCRTINEYEWENLIVGEIYTFWESNLQKEEKYGGSTFIHCACFYNLQDI